MPTAEAEGPPSVWTILRWHYRHRSPEGEELSTLAEQARETPEHLAKRASRLYTAFALPSGVVGAAVALLPVWLAIRFLPSSTVDAAAAGNLGAQVMNVLLVGTVAACAFVLLIPMAGAIASLLWMRIVLKKRWANRANVEAMIRGAQPYFD